MEEIGLEVPRSGYAGGLGEARRDRRRDRLPADHPAQLHPRRRGRRRGLQPRGVRRAGRARRSTPARRAQVLVEQSVLGWKEYELEVMRDRADNVVVVCSIENFDAMGVHTGDSITVAPAQTLTDREYQAMRDDAFAVIRRVGVDTGGSNIQFAVDPADRPAGGHRDEPARVAQLGPGVARRPASRSPRSPPCWRSATPWTRSPTTSPARPSPPSSRALDYTVVKIPRWAFEKFPAHAAGAGHPDEVGGRGDGDRRAPSARRCMKGLRSLELDGDVKAREARMADPMRLRQRLAVPNWERLFALFAALRQGWAVEEVAAASRVDPWFLREIAEIVDVEAEVACWDLATVPEMLLREAKRSGLSGRRLAELLHCRGRRAGMRDARGGASIRPVFKRVDTCAAEFAGRHAVPLLDLRASEDESRADRAAQGDDPRRRARTASARASSSTTAACHAAFALSRGRLRDHHGQLQPGDGLHRLRHRRPALLRAADPRGRAGDRRARAARGRHRAARRADAAQAGARARGGGGADLGHLARRDRPGRGPRPLRRAAAPS